MSTKCLSSQENFPVQVKQECIEHIFQPVADNDDTDYEPVDPLEHVNGESDNEENGTSEYEPDSEYSEDGEDNGSDEVSVII